MAARTTALMPTAKDVFWDEKDENVYVVVAHTAYRACSPMELELKKANRIVVLDRTSRENWYFGVKGRYGKSGWFPIDVVVPVEEYAAFLENAAKVRGFENALRRLGRTTTANNEPHSGGHLIPSPIIASTSPALLRSQSLPVMSPISRRRRNSTNTSDGLNALSAFYCPLSGQLFTDPVVDIDGRSLDQGSFSTLYGQDTEIPLPNHTLRAALEEVMTRQEANLPLANTKPLIQVLDQHSSTIAKLEQRKLDLENKLKQLKTANESLYCNCDVFRDVNNQPVWQLREASGGRGHWLIMLCRRLSHLRMSVPPKGNELSDMIEDTLEELVEISLRTRLNAVNIWEINRNSKTAEEKHALKRRRRINKTRLVSLFSLNCTSSVKTMEQTPKSTGHSDADIV